MATIAPTKPKPAPTPETVHRTSIAEWAVTILILLFGTSMIAQPFVIPTSSMHNTLYTGDHLIVDKLAYAPAGSISKHLLPYEDVKRGDIIVFRHPTLITVDYVKRVIGIPGDHVKLINKQVYVNGKALTEPYAIHLDNSLNYRDNFPLGEPDYVVFFLNDTPTTQIFTLTLHDALPILPKESFFAMGENRDNSLDSRYWGMVPRENIT